MCVCIYIYIYIYTHTHTDNKQSKLKNDIDNCKSVGVCMCGFCNMWVFDNFYEGFGNMCTCIYCVFVLFRLCIFLFVTSVRTTATE